MPSPTDPHQSLLGARVGREEGPQVREVSVDHEAGVQGVQGVLGTSTQRDDLDTQQSGSGDFDIRALC